jgi:hypothetical protein
MAMTFEKRAKLILLPVVVIAGCAVWILRPVPSDAEVRLVPSAVIKSAQNLFWFDPVITPVQATLAVPAEATAPAESVPAAAAAPTENLPPEAAPPVEGLKISSQSWRRGGLGSKALVTLTLRNGNEYAVRDIEIFCSFTRRDGSHLTDRKRVISDAVRMKSQKTFAKMHVGFVNVHADKAKCALLAASRM